MRVRDSFLMYKSDVESLARECNVKESDMGEFLDFFENESSWIGVVVEKFLDERSNNQ